MTKPLALAAALLLAACGTLEYPGTTEYSLDPVYGKRRPAEVSVLPVAGSLSDEASRALREGLRSRLLDLHYAPVRLDAIDRNPAEYMPGGLRAVMEVIVDRWDDSGLFGDGTVRVTGEVRLFGSGSRDVLFRGKLVDVPVKASFVARTSDERSRTVAQAAEEAAGRFLERLPAKGD